MFATFFHFRIQFRTLHCTLREYPSLLGFPREVSSWMTQRGGWPIFGSSACQTQCHRSHCHTRVEDKRPMQGMFFQLISPTMYAGWLSVCCFCFDNVLWSEYLCTLTVWICVEHYLFKVSTSIFFDRGLYR